jgi:uncharacterized protein with HEPN domain
LPPTLADRLRHILEAIEDMEQILAGKTETQFAADRFLRLSVERLFEIISEASRHVPMELKANASHIAWPRVADLGNRLRHAYHRVDAAIVWQIYENDVPALKAFVERIIESEQSC